MGANGNGDASGLCLRARVETTQTRADAIQPASCVVTSRTKVNTVEKVLFSNRSPHYTQTELSQCVVFPRLRGATSFNNNIANSYESVMLNDLAAKACAAARRNRLSANNAYPIGVLSSEANKLQRKVNCVRLVSHLLLRYSFNSQYFSPL